MTDKKQPRSTYPEQAKLQSPDTCKNNRRLSYKDMVKTAIISQRKPRGSSTQDILNYICSNYTIKDKTKAKHHLKNALTVGVKTGLLKDNTDKKTTRYFILATDETRNIRHPTRLNKESKNSSPLPSLSKRTTASQKSDFVNSVNRYKSKTSAANKETSSLHKDKSKASLKAPVVPSAKPQKNRGRKYGVNKMSCNIRSKAADQTTLKYVRQKNQYKRSTDLVSSDCLDSETPSQIHEIHTISHKETLSTVDSDVDLSHIQATLRETNILPLLTAPIKALAIATDGKKLILEINTNNVRLYSPDMRKHLSCLKLKDKPIDIAVTGDNQAVITTGHLIYFIDFSSDFLSVMYTFFSTDYVVYGITACQEYIYVACQDGNVAVKMIDSSGNIYWSVSLDKMENERDRSFLGITSFDADGHVRLVVTDEEENTIKLLSGESGELLATYFTRNLDVSSPVTDIYNNVYVWYLASVVVKVLTSDLSAERSLAASKSHQRMPFQSGDNKRVPRHYFRRMAYDRNSNQLVLSVELGQLQIFQLNQK